MRNVVGAVAAVAVYVLGALVGITGCFTGAAAAQETSSVGGTAADHSKPVAAGAYYIEFRVAEIGAYGHSYVMYGRLGGNGQPADRHNTPTCTPSATTHSWPWVTCCRCRPIRPGIRTCLGCRSRMLTGASFRQLTTRSCSRPSSAPTQTASDSGMQSRITAITTLRRWRGRSA